MSVHPVRPRFRIACLLQYLLALLCSPLLPTAVRLLLPHIIPCLLNYETCRVQLGLRKLSSASRGSPPWCLECWNVAFPLRDMPSFCRQRRRCMTTSCWCDLYPAALQDSTSLLPASSSGSCSTPSAPRRHLQILRIMVAAGALWERGSCRPDTPLPSGIPSHIRPQHPFLPPRTVPVSFVSPPPASRLC